AARSVISSFCGENWCNPGSSKQIVTGTTFISQNSPIKSLFCIGMILESALSRPSKSADTIISRTAWIRLTSKNRFSTPQTCCPCTLTKKLTIKIVFSRKEPRVNATPVAQSSPILPRSMAYTLSAVPQWEGILFKRRYVTAR
ncbi:MAG: hypothetical protein ACI8W9_001700, partial [Psychromonas sp.]